MGRNTRKEIRKVKFEDIIFRKNELDMQDKIETRHTMHFNKHNRLHRIK